MPDNVIRLPLLCLESPPTIHRLPSDPQDDTRSGSSGDTDDDEGYDMVFFCHSMYGIESKQNAIEQALNMLVKPRGGMVVVFHCGRFSHLDGLVYHETASFPTGLVRVADDNQVIDDFAPFISDFAMHGGDVHKAVHIEWRGVCRDLGQREEAYPDCLSFRFHDIMEAFSQHATRLPELTAQLAALKGDRQIKNREACLCHPAAIYRPTEIHYIQVCVRWVLKHGVGLTVIAGGHCVWNNTVSVNISAFNGAHILTTEEEGGPVRLDCDAVVAVEAGCTTGDVIRGAMVADVTVPLGSRPSVGAGLWLQGGIGHLARLHGLACDAVISRKQGS
jgi:hypothetical protein